LRHRALSCSASGSYISGYLDWYNANIDEVSDRDIALVAPISIRRAGGEAGGTDTGQALDFSVVVLSARDIATLYVSYVAN
jgi:hypothetical protein